MLLLIEIPEKFDKEWEMDCFANSLFNLSRSCYDMRAKQIGIMLMHAFKTAKVPVVYEEKHTDAINMTKYWLRERKEK